MSSQSRDASSREAEPKTAAIGFFRDPDLCTLFCKVVIASGRPSRTVSSRACVTTANVSSLLAFRGVTCEAWNAVMLEQRTRSALGLLPQDEAVEGVLVYSKPNEFAETRGPPYNRPDLAYPFLSHNPDDAAAFRALEIADPTCKEWNQRGPRSCIVTHHRAAHHRHCYYPPYRGSDFWILLEDYELCAALPLAREMFLTQPPQKSIRFGLRYHYKPSVGGHFWIHNEDGVRFGDVVAQFTERPELLEQILEPGHPMYWARRWLSSSEVVRLDRIVWTYNRAVVKDCCIEDHARSNTEEREMGGAGFENCTTWRR